MNFDFLKLKNGLRVIFIQPEVASTILLFFIIKVGSDNEKKGEEGLAHFVEHMVFKGTKNFPEQKIIFKELDKIGGKFNGATSHQYTYYYIKTLEDYFSESLFILADLIKNPLFREENIQEEKKIVISELKEKMDDPFEKVFLNCLDLLYHDLPQGRSIIGLESSIKDFNRDKIVDFKNKFYNSKNSFLLVIGKLRNKQKIFKLIEKNFNDLISGKEFDFPQVKSKQNDFVKIEKAKVNQNYLVLGLHSSPINKLKKLISLKLANKILGEMAYSRLFLSLRSDKNLCYSCGSELDIFSNRLNLFIFAIVNKEKLKESLEVLKDEIKKTIKDGFNSEEIFIAKNKFTFDTLTIFEDPIKLANYYFFNLFILGKKPSKNNLKKILSKKRIEEFVNLVKKIKNDEINSMFKELIFRNKFCLSLLIPEDSNFSEKEAVKIIKELLVK